MSLAELTLSYGYLAVFLGTFLEGETVLVMAGFAAYGGYLNLYWVMGVATLGSFMGDQLFYFLGTRYGRQILERFPILKPRAARVLALIERYHTPLIPGIRFMYGLRIVAPLVFGMSAIPWYRFFLLNLLGALVWAILVSGAGYLFGEVLELLLADIHRYEAILLASLAVAGIAVWLGYLWRHR